MRSQYFAALTFLFVINQPAASFACTPGASGCLIDEGTAEKLIRPTVDGKTNETYGVSFLLFVGSIQVGRDVSPGSNNEALQRQAQILEYLKSNQDCQRIEQSIRHGGNHSDLPQTCRLVQSLKARNMLREVRAVTGRPTEQGFGFATQSLAIHIWMNDEAQAQLRPLMHKHDSLSVQIAISTTKFIRTLRKQERQLGGKSVSIVEYEYEVVPNIWYEIRNEVYGTNRKPNIEKRTGTAIFSQWSDGWRLEGTH